MAEESDISEQVDPSAEIKAMGLIADAFKSLPKAAITRVLRWANDHYGMHAAVGRPRESISITAEAATAEGRDASQYSELPDFYTACGPGTEAEKALVVGYWFQFHEGAMDFDTQRVNNELKHLGYQIGNITRAFDNLESAQPRLVIQIRKLGNTKQARKRLKLTVEGKKAVEQMLSRSTAA